jgi:hypothetical protein
LLEPVVAFVVAPVNEDGPMINAWAMISPPFKPHVVRGEGGGGRSLPGKIALCPVGAEDNYRAAVAVAISPGFVLAGITNVKDADGPYEIELRTADVDVCTILYAAQGIIRRNEIV